MQLTPAQVGMSLMIHGSLPMMGFASVAEGIARGRQALARLTGQDFGYDLNAWHDYLIASNAGGYKWSNKHRGFPKSINSALADEAWQRAVDFATSDSLFERLNDRDLRRQQAIDHAELEWAGKPRRCPKCEAVFTSVKDRGQCRICSYIFYASHPESGNSMWWLEIT